MDNVAGFLEVDRTNDTHEIIISHPALTPDADGWGRIVLLPHIHVIWRISFWRTRLMQKLRLPGSNPEAGTIGG